MGIFDDLKAEEAKLRGIRAKKGEANGYNYPGGKELRIKRSKAKAQAARGRTKKDKPDGPAQR